MAYVRNIPFLYQRNGPIVLEKSEISDESEDKFKAAIQEISSEITSVTNNLLNKAYKTFSNELKLKTDKIKKLELQILKYKERIKELEVNLETPSFVENKENSNYDQRSEEKVSQINVFKESFNYADNNHQESMQKNIAEISQRSPNITNLPQQHLMSYQAAQSFGLSYQMQGCYTPMHYPHIPIYNIAYNLPYGPIYRTIYQSNSFPFNTNVAEKHSKFLTGPVGSNTFHASHFSTQLCPPKDIGSRMIITAENLKGNGDDAENPLANDKEGYNVHHQKENITNLCLTKSDTIKSENESVNSSSKCSQDMPSCSSRKERNHKSRNKKKIKHGSPSKVIDANLNSTLKPKLKPSENAWKPSFRKQEQLIDKEITEQEYIIPKMKVIFNKLTANNMDELFKKVTQIKIKDVETLEKVAELIFERAVDEQQFSTIYAQLCKLLSQIYVKVQGKGGETKFKKMIIIKCQIEFEKDNSKDLKRKEIELQKDHNKKTKMKATLYFEEMRLRKRLVGNIRFIGELYKLKMLTSSLMMRIIMILLDKKDDESLECLCKLLTTIGKMLEISAQPSQRAQDDLNEIFSSMKALVDSRKTTSRVRFLMMDVVDLRLNNWVLRREDAKPKTKAEVHEDVQKEEIEQHILSAAPIKDDRERKNDNRMMLSDDSGWTTVTKNTRRGPFDSSQASVVDHLELQTEFSSWGKDSSGGVKDKGDDQKISNHFSILEMPFEMDRPLSELPPILVPGENVHRQGTGSFSSNSMPPPSEKETTSTKNIIIPRGDRSKSNSRSNSRQALKERALPIPVLGDEVAEKYTKSIADEYVSNNDLKSNHATNKELNFDIQDFKVKLGRVFESNTSEKSKLSWIQDYAGNNMKDKKFVRVLTTIFIGNLLADNEEKFKLDENFKNEVNKAADFLNRFINQEKNAELACILGFQDLCVERNHPEGLLEFCLNIFYEKEIISSESFIAWLKSDNPEDKLGKKACITSVKKLLSWIVTLSSGRNLMTK